MRIFRQIGLVITLVAFFTSATWAKSRHRDSSSGTTRHATNKKSRSPRSKSRSKTKRKAWQAKGQKTITSDRTREIQEALIRGGYLTGQPTGVMDSSTKEALTRLQQQSGWQTKIVPDARALIKLGLGPSQANLLNPETAAVAGNFGAR